MKQKNILQKKIFAGKITLNNANKDQSGVLNTFKDINK